MRSLILLIIWLNCVQICWSQCGNQYKKQFDELLQQPQELVFADDFSGSWKEQWMLDGLNARILQKDNALELYAGERPHVDADHTVLWTKKEFEGDLRIEYDFTRLDSSSHYFVNIIYIQAQGSGIGPYEKDISRWNALREVPIMSAYFKNMDTYHISYAVTGQPYEQKREYIRGRRYMPSTGKLKGTELYPEYFDTGLFKKDVTYHMTILKRGKEMYMNVRGDGRNCYFYFNASKFPAIHKGRIGLRQMYTRNSRYENFKVYIFQ